MAVNLPEIHRGPAGFPGARFWLLLLLASALACGGCRKRPPPEPGLRSITRDLVAAAQKAAGHGAEIDIRPEMKRLRGGEARLAADQLYIRLADPAKGKAVEDSLEQVARRYGLTRNDRLSSPGVIRFDYLRDGRRTHSIHIIIPLAAGAGEPAGAKGRGPRLAIIVDDIGNDPAAAEALLSLPYPLTLSILPHEPYSTEIAEETFRRGDAVMLHMPMEPENDGARPEAIELRTGMSAGEVEQLLEGMLATVPHATGANNHEGSRATADPQLMAEVMEGLRQHNFFFVDSRTTPATVAYAAARRAGVPAAYRKVFLDDVDEQPAILRQLDLAARDASRQGWAIAIGHPHPATLAALAEGLPRLQARGVRLVFASSLAR